MIRAVGRAAAMSLALAAAPGCGDEPRLAEASPAETVVPAAPSSAPDDGVAPSLLGGPAATGADAAGGGAGVAARSPLDGFRDDLIALSRGERREHVRVLVLGDSHTAADLWTGTLRADLQARFGDGGPGFVHLGVPGARHDALHLSQDGHTTTEPRTPSSLDGVGDGVLGLGSVLARPKKGRLTILVTPRVAADAPIRWEVCARAGREASRVTVTPSGGAPVVRSFAPGPGGSTVERLATITRPPHALEVRVDGDAALCGAIGEREPSPAPGVVLDAVGINGARAATFLARDEGAMVEEVRRRSPSLVVVEVGGNEAAEEGTDPSVFADELGRLVERLRRGAPGASCLVVGPTEQVARPERTAAIARVFGERAEAMGCAFWDAAAKLGGAGAMRRMMDEHPPRAHVDGIHLVERGYRDLARLTLADLVRGLPDPR